MNLQNFWGGPGPCGPPFPTPMLKEVSGEAVVVLTKLLVTWSHKLNPVLYCCINFEPMFSFLHVSFITIFLSKALVS